MEYDLCHREYLLVIVDNDIKNLENYFLHGVLFPHLLIFLSYFE